MTYDVLVVGGGPAGISCAVFTARFGLRTAVVDRMGVGGQLVNVHLLKDFPGFPAGVEGWNLAAAMGEQAAEAGVEVLFGEVGAIEQRDGPAWRVEVDAQAIESKVVVFAMGSSPVLIPGEGTETLVGRGISYCASCDAEFFRGQAVAVIGGGDTGMSEATCLAPVAERVTILFQESEPPAAAAWQADVKREANVELRPMAKAFDVISADGGVVGLRYLDLREGQEKELRVSGIFGAAGIRPNSEPARSVAGTDAGGWIVTDSNFACDSPGLYAVGDVRAGSSKQAAGAVGEGVTAATAIREYLKDTRLV